MRSCSCNTPPPQHCYQTPLTVSLCLSQTAGFGSSSLPSVVSHLAFPSRTSEKLSSPNWLFNTFFSSNTWAQQGAARVLNHYCSAAGLNGWAVFSFFQLPWPVWTPPVSQQYSLPIWEAHGVLWSMCLVSTPIAKRIRLPMDSHAASLFFSSVFCVLESSLWHGPCSYTWLSVKL
jgi:hypothetical protein